MHYVATALLGVTDISAETIFIFTSQGRTSNRASTGSDHIITGATFGTYCFKIISIYIDPDCLTFFYGTRKIVGKRDIRLGGEWIYASYQKYSSKAEMTVGCEREIGRTDYPLPIDEASVDTYARNSIAIPHAGPSKVDINRK